MIPLKTSPLMLVGAALVLATTGCQIIPRDLGTFPQEKLIVVNGKGQLLKPVGNISATRYSSLNEMKRCVLVKKEEAYLDAVADNIKTQLTVGNEVVVFIHGGLNGQVESMERARKLFDYEESERAAGRECPHFILLNWQSSLTSSYRDRLLAIREGKDFRETESLIRYGIKFTSIAYLASDVLTGAARSPITLDRQIDNFRNGIGLDPRTDFKIANRDFKQAPLWGPTELVAPQGFHAGNLAPSALMLPLRLGLTPLVDAFGTPAWDIMQRRTTILFSREALRNQNSTDWAQGPLYKLGVKFDQSGFERSAKSGAKLTLVCHSMGAILGSEILRRFPDLHFDRVVFMAAASRVRDLTDCVFPYMMHSGNQRTEFYNLTLHPDAELRESNAWHLAPQGSLLVWLDQMFDRPDSALDRMAGRYTNLGLNALYLNQEIERAGGEALSKRIHLKCFPYEKGSHPGVPMKHGSFSNFNFWEPAFYQPEPRISYQQYVEEMKN